MLHIQEYLKTNSPESLTEKYGIAVKRHAKYPNLVMFKYSMIESPMDEPIVQESRGLILDQNDNYKVICYTYKKFFNEGEGRAAKIDWKTARVLEKVDGSLCQLFYYDNAWQIASSGMPDAGGEVQGFGLSFAELFWKVWNELGYHLPESYKNYCFAFELMTPFNKIVVQHKKNRLVVHGCRNLDTLQEYDAKEFMFMNWEFIKSFPLTSIEEVLATCEHIPAIEGEGYVIVDAEFNRIKVKTPQYVALAHIRDAMSTRRMLEIVRANESSEFLVYFPEYRGLYEKVVSSYDAFVKSVEENYEKHKNIETQKDFAMAVKDLQGSGFYFGMRKGKTLKEIMAEMPIKNLQETLKLKDINLLTIE